VIRKYKINFVAQVSNASGYHLDVHLYKEETSVQLNGTVQTVYRTWSGHHSLTVPSSGTATPALGGGGKAGPLDGLLVNFPYSTKDNLQQKRYAAQKMQTTYVYDYPEMFNQVHANFIYCFHVFSGAITNVEGPHGIDAQSAT
jgi:hypothetical protein